MTPGIGIWIPRRGGHSSVSAALGGGGASLKASLHMNNRDTWWDANDGDFASPGGLFKFSTQDMTAEFWVKLTTGTLTASANLVMGSTDDTKSFKAEFTSGDTYGRFGGEWVSNSGAISEDAWHHIATAWDASAGTAYINVDNAGWTTRGTTQQTDPVNYFGFRLGDWGAGSGHLCKVAEVRLWDHLRTAQQISDNYQSCISPGESGLVALYASANANVGSITTISDEAGSNDATRQNGTNGAWDDSDLPF